MEIKHISIIELCNLKGHLFVGSPEFPSYALSCRLSDAQPASRIQRIQTRKLPSTTWLGL